MTPEHLLDLSIDLIDVPRDRARDFDADNAQALAAVIAAQGLFHPIRVRAIGERYVLIAGLHRLRAFGINGQATIPAIVSAADSDDAARLEEVMENLGRGELIALDRCHHLFELKQVWERMYPQAAHGKASPKGQTLPLSEDAPEIFGFARATAEKIGLSSRSIKLAVKIWSDLSAASRGRLIGTGLARKQTELKALSELKPAKQEKVLDMILDPETDVGNVAGALQAMEEGIVMTSVERQFSMVSKGLKAMPDDVFARLMIEHEARVIAALKRAGRL
ncbi:putative chromosome-partitioning protein ParB [Aquimixticola soesokkakensis]|uniref:Putative chromosome-partitioning protein ParB n=1 Tax=Aquimixticola soesokkakensis TaxID=1519096 RepID=A0A1Y5SFK4_9RHOB|nr:ParB N-terminal domain-containing protein [Aquimixticola soesokkakensis]SLN38446.1 putative chromosome-partitioning protein ParB [Aquimixticola soesokkakensis]